MKNQSTSFVRTSCRRILIAATALGPLLTAHPPIQAQTGQSESKPVNARRLPVRKAAKPLQTSQRGIRTEHRPPFTLDEGSLLIGALAEVGDGLKQMRCVNTDTKQTCTAVDAPARPPRTLSVAATMDDGYVSFHNHTIRIPKWAFMIWLEKEADNGEFEPVSSGDAPQIIVRNPYIIEIEKPDSSTLIFTPANCRHTLTPERPCKYEHPGYPGSDGTFKRIRIRRIDFVRGDGNPITLGLSSNRLRVSLNLIPEPHPHPVRAGRGTQNKRRK